MLMASPECTVLHEELIGKIELNYLNAKLVAQFQVCEREEGLVSGDKKACCAQEITSVASAAFQALGALHPHVPPLSLLTSKDDLLGFLVVIS